MNITIKPCYVRASTEKVVFPIFAKLTQKPRNLQQNSSNRRWCSGKS